MPRPTQSAFPTPKRKRNPIPYLFVLEALAPLDPIVHPMFGGHSVYIADKVVLMLRDKPNTPHDKLISWISMPSLGNDDIVHRAGHYNTNTPDAAIWS